MLTIEKHAFLYHKQLISSYFTDVDDEDFYEKNGEFITLVPKS